MTVQLLGVSSIPGRFSSAFGTRAATTVQNDCIPFDVEMRVKENAVLVLNLKRHPNYSFKRRSIAGRGAGVETLFTSGIL